MRSRGALVLVGCIALLAPLAPAGAASDPGGMLVLTDVAGDANGVNDQGEGLVKDRPGTVPSAAEADLRSLRLATLAGPRRLRMTVATTAPLTTHGDSGQPLELSVIVFVTGDCLFGVAVTTRDGKVDGATLERGGCSEQQDQPVAVTAVQNGTSVSIDVPYRLLPQEARPGTRVRDLRVATRLAPGGGASVGELDNAHDFGVRLPG